MNKQNKQSKENSKQTAKTDSQIKSVVSTIMPIIAIVTNSVVFISLFYSAAKILPSYEEFFLEAQLQVPIMPYFLIYSGLLCTGIGLFLGLWCLVLNKKGKNSLKTSIASILLGALGLVFCIIVLAMLLSVLYSTAESFI